MLYAAADDELDAVEQEAEAARRAGLAVRQAEDAGLPFPVAGAVELAEQIRFQPLRYARGLAAAVDGDGSFVFERSRALQLKDGAPCRVRTKEGRVSAAQIVVATHFPVFDRGVFFARMEAERSYCVAARVRGEPPRTMAINAGSPTRSIASDGELLIVGGEGHKAGARTALTEGRYAELERFARRHWEVEALTHRWSAQDPTAYDHLPVVGPLVPGSSRLFVASGFMKWGLTGGTTAATILADLIAGRENPWSPYFSPSRLSLGSTPRLARMNAEVGIDMVGDRLKPAEAGSAADVPRGEARVVRDGLGKTGVYRDEQDELHGVSLRCTHLGCLLRFNADERSWDCPCHGSRFDVDGEVLEGPAVKPLERRDVATQAATPS